MVQIYQNTSDTPNSLGLSFKKGKKGPSILADFENLFHPLSPIPPVPGTIDDALFPPRPFKAVLFDIYGTLLCSGAGDIGLTSLEGEDNTRLFSIAGRPDCSLPFGEVKQKLKAIIKEEHSRISRENQSTSPEVDIIRVWALFYEGIQHPEKNINKFVQTALTFELLNNPVDFMPGSLAVLKRLKTEGLALGIVSNAQFYTPLILEYLSRSSLEDLGFSPELCSWSYRLGRAKPDVLIFEKPLAKLKEMGIKREEILYVGNDMLKDVAPASRLGLGTALFAGDQRSLRLRQESKSIRGIYPDYCLSKMEQIHKIIKEV